MEAGVPPPAWPIHGPASHLIVPAFQPVGGRAKRNRRPLAGPAAEDVLSALTNLGYQRPAAQKAIEAAVEKDKSLGQDFDALFRAALKVIR